jgi:hypothetical protein
MKLRKLTGLLLPPAAHSPLTCSTLLPEVILPEN